MVAQRPAINFSDGFGKEKITQPTPAFFFTNNHMKQKYNLAINVAVPVAAAVVINGIIFARGWNDAAPTRSRNANPLLPPGWAIGIVWLVVLAALGYARWTLGHHGHSAVAATWSVVAVTTVIALCLAYPFYTRGLRQDRVAALLNLAVLVASFLMAMTVAATGQKDALAAIAPLLAWLSYVNAAQVWVPPSA